jgi:hypothetical protein
MDKFWPEQEVFEAVQRALSAKKRAPSKKLLSYLTKFQHDELTTGTTDMPISYAVQHEKLIEAMRKKFPVHGYRQLIKGSGMDVDIPKFWELMFAMHYVTHEIEIVNNIGFDSLEIATGISTFRKIPHAEFKIVGKELRRDIAKPTPAATTSELAVHKATLTLTDLNLKIRVDGRYYLVKRYQNKTKNSYRAINKLYTYAGQPLKKEELNLSLDAKTALKDIPKSMGFNGVLREFFIENGYVDKHPTLTLHKSRDVAGADYARLMGAIKNLKQS